jgi:hypothetical protein
MLRNGNGDPGMRLLLMDRLGGPGPHDWMQALLSFCGFSSTSAESSCNLHALHRDCANGLCREAVHIIWRSWADRS